MAFEFAGRYGPEIFEDEQRHLLKSAAVSVVEVGTFTPVPLYTDRTKGAAAANPFLTDVRGNGMFFADPGEYDLLYAGWRLTVTVDMDFIEAQGDGPPTGPATGDLDGFYPDPIIRDLAIGTGKLANLAVTAAKIANLTITGAQIANNTITQGKTDGTFADAATTAANLAAAINALRTEILDAPPGLLDTLNELAAALGDDPNFAATVTANIATKVDKATFDANSILKADADNTPIALPVGPSTILARLAAGGIVAATPAEIRVLLGMNPVDSYTGDLGAGTGTVVVNHALNTTDIRSIIVKKVSTGEIWGVRALVTDANNVTLDFDTYNRSANEFRVEIAA